VEALPQLSLTYIPRIIGIVMKLHLYNTRAPSMDRHLEILELLASLSGRYGAATAHVLQEVAF
jgi:hypothetical protein